MHDVQAQQWATSPPGDNAGVGPRVVSVNLPVGAAADKQCGKGVHIDAHVNSVTTEELQNLTGDVIDERYPAGCSPTLLPTEHLLAFFFFDLASCIQKETATPAPPTPIK